MRAHLQLPVVTAVRALLVTMRTTQGWVTLPFLHPQLVPPLLEKPWEGGASGRKLPPPLLVMAKKRALVLLLALVLVLVVTLLARVLAGWQGASRCPLHPA